MLLGEVTEFELAHIVSRVRAAVNRCEHEPSYTSDDTITKKLLAVLAKDGRHTPEFLANFNAYAFVIGTLCADGAAHAAASSTDSGRVAAPGTPDPPAATAAPKIASFRTPENTEGQAQAEYAEAAGRFHSKRRADERAEESRKKRKLEAMLAQIYEARVAQELREARYKSEMHDFVAENVARRHGPDAAWCTQPPPPLHPHRPAHVHSRTTSQHPVPGRQLHLIAIFAYRSLYPPCEEAHQQRVQESAEAIAELMTEYAYVSDARASRTAGTIGVALHARALARSWSQNVQLLRVTMRAWRELVGSEAAAVARERQRSYERWAQQDVEAERRHKNLEAQRIFCQGQRSAPS